MRADTIQGEPGGEETGFLQSLDVGDEGRLRLVRSADLLASYPFEVWHYGDSVGFEGLLAAADLLGADRFESWVYGALKAWAARRRPFVELDNTAPGHAMCLTFERTGDEAVLEAARDLSAYLLERPTIQGGYVSFSEAPLREPHGGATLSDDEAALLRAPGAGLFVDCLHFDPPFFAHLGRLTDDRELLERAAAQALAYVRVLQDESGLFWHFWLERTQARYGFAWSRGQGWALLGLLDVLQYLPSDHAAHAELRQALHRLASALRERQQPSGAWPAVADDPSSGTEASTSAFVAAGFAHGVEAGLLSDAFREPAERAWSDAWRNVDERGALEDVSAAVWASTARSHYVHVPRGFVVPWGQGPLLLAALRIARLRARSATQ